MGITKCVIYEALIRFASLSTFSRTGSIITAFLVTESASRYVYVHDTVSNSCRNSRGPPAERIGNIDFIQLRSRRIFACQNKQPIPGQSISRDFRLFVGPKLIARQK
ncbi:unnamed protein product [Calicophoron daubneyi]|uniref:Secreted protein n=1 Tax=Calicophoron daubneyi TaxID=300641 RepID=A0AAV2TGC0_CALDB